MSAAAKYTVGQKLWWVPPFQFNKDRNGGFEVTVTKVGIKYVTVSLAFDKSRRPTERVFNKDSGYEKGDLGQSRCGRAWLSREAYDEHMEITAAWQSLCELASRKLQRYASPPSNLTLVEITAMKSTLEALS
jgi:hypothetical protein